MRILIYGQVFRPHHRECLLEALGALGREGFEVFIDEDYRIQTDSDINQYRGLTSFKNFLLTPVDVVMAFGGDGTVLGAVAMVNESEIPIMGINLGRLGFLSSIEGRHVTQAISELKKNRFHYDERTMIQLESDHPDIFPDTRLALNDFTLHKRDTSSMIIIHTYINGELLNSFWADGLIVATPTGSTGYSLSCGGPIIFPNASNFVITPVAPHNLTVRPIIVPDTSEISFEIEGRSDNFLCTLDSRFESVTAGYKLLVRKAAVKARFIQLYNYSFLRTLHDKLIWGKDSRN